MTSSDSHYAWLSIIGALTVAGCPGDDPVVASTGAGASSSSSNATTGGSTSTASSGGNGNGGAGGGGGCIPQPPAVCGRDDNGVVCGFSDGDAFSMASLWGADFSDANFWTDPDRYRTLQFPDVNGDGLFDACGRTSAGIVCALSDGTTLGSTSVWSTVFTPLGFASPEHYSTIRFPDVNGDGLDDVCGRGNAGVYCSLSDGSTFVDSSFAHESYFNDGNFDQIAHYATLQYPDVNGDGKADVCGRDLDGIHCALSDGQSFTAATNWSDQFDAIGWLDPEHYVTLQFPDVDGDGRADACGRTGSGIYCALSTGTAFGTGGYWESQFSDANGWALGPEYYATIQFPDVNGDGLADVCGRHTDGIMCGISNGSTFSPATLATPSYSDAASWNLPEHYRTIQFPDVNGDGKADVCGRGGNGITCAISNGTSFTTSSDWDNHFSNGNGWVAEEYRGTIHFPSSRYGRCPSAALPTPPLRPIQRFVLP